jgi:chitin disaccharide deacetylase
MKLADPMIGIGDGMTERNRLSHCRLIINADDFGASQEINEAVIRGYREGVLTSASLIVSGSAADGAITLARQNPGLAVGLHLVLAAGRAVLPTQVIPHLVDKQGRFPESCGWAGVRDFFSPASRRELRRELRAQFQRFAATGLALSHVDGHKHFHVHPAVFPEVVRLASAFGARGIRLPADPTRGVTLRNASRAIEALTWSIAFRLLRHWCQRQLLSVGLQCAFPTLGLMQCGAIDEQTLLGLIDRVATPLTEIYLHPTVGARVHRLGANQQELEALLSPAVRRLIDERGIELTSYRDLAEAECPSSIGPEHPQCSN